MADKQLISVGPSPFRTPQRIAAPSSTGTVALGYNQESDDWLYYVPSGAGSLTDHDHTTTGDGGKLSAGVVDTYLLFEDTTTPSTPSNASILFAQIEHTHSVLDILHPDGDVVRPTRDQYNISKVVLAGGVSKGDVLYISGATGANEEVDRADASAAATMPAIGLATEAGALNEFIRVQTAGKLGGLDTSSFNEGDTVYVSETTGALTATKPSWPALQQRVGIVTRSHATVGEILIIPGTAIERPTLALDDLSDAAISSASNSQVLQYNGTNFVNVAFLSMVADFHMVGSVVTSEGITDPPELVWSEDGTEFIHSEPGQ